MAKRAPAVPAYHYAAAIMRVLDGDTVWARIDLGFRSWAEMPLRLYGLNAPEKDTDTGKAAKAFAQAWVDEHPAIVVSTFKNPEKFGRWLAVISDGAEGDTAANLTLNAALMAAGHAFPWDGQGATPIA